MSSTPSLFIHRYLPPIAASVWPVERTDSYTVQYQTFLPLARMSPLQYLAAKVASNGMGSLYSISSGSALVQKSERIFQWLLAEAALEAERPLAMASVVAQKVHMKRCWWTGSISAMAVAGVSVC